MGLRRGTVALVCPALGVALVGAVLFGCRSEPSPDIDIGTRSKVLARLAKGAPLEFGEWPRAFYVVAFPKSALDSAIASYPAEIRPALSLGLIALSQRSARLGYRLVWCSTSGWFEDPAHGETFSQAGEYIEGPASRGMDLYPVRLTDDDHLVVNTRRAVPGVPVGTHTVDSTPRGPRCVGR